MNDYIKIGELASITGITIRTLHYYDEIGLLQPVKITEANHRLYNMQSITELYRIMALKDMGFNLEEINDLIRTKNIDVRELVEIHINNVQEEICQKQLLLRKLLKINQRLRENVTLSSEDLREMAQFINSSADKFFTKEQLNKLKGKLDSFNPETDLANEWIKFISKLKACYKNQALKTDTAARECVEYWSKITRKLIGNDEQMKDSITAFHASQENTQLRYGLTDELYEYLMTLMS
ncbi:MerR family transcriptional regulator [Alkaliphilus transvaalensis]|uniref:MerR family transcriptional regulator n=1 Tax=Alkaliphilus transvaalensis TaxID=114628 RepID=UPI00047B51F9|nr:MerR family transcriptional regulator [Alkaliphilus transvaalensis]